MSHLLCSLHDQALKLSKQYLACEKELLEILVKIEAKKVYLEQGHASLTEYSQKALGLSRDVCWNLVTIVHKSKAIPELRHAVQMGVLPLSKARQIAPHLTKENSQKFIALAQAMPREKLQEALAKESPKIPSVEERARVINATQAELSLCLPKEVMEKIRRAQDRVSESQKKWVGLAETLEQVVEFYLQHKDPKEKARRHEVRKNKAPVSVKQSHRTVRESAAAARDSEFNFRHINKPRTKIQTIGRIPIPAGIKHEVIIKNAHQCTYQDPRTKLRCEKERFLHIHHKLPVTMGGTNALENLTMLCSAHHRLEHYQSSG